MQRLEVSGAVRPIYGSLGVKRLIFWLLAGPGNGIPVEARFSAPVQTGPGTHPTSYTKGTVSFPGVKSGLDVTLTPPPMGRTACTEPQCLYKGALQFYLTWKILHNAH